MINYRYRFNELLLQYNKCRRKLANLQIKNRNVRRQQLLKKRITQLYEKLTNLKQTIKLSTAATATFVGLSLATPQAAQAQHFLPLQKNPFGLTTIASGEYSSPALVDMDGDGDLDMLSGDVYGNFYYYQDTSSTSTPAYDTAQVNPFGLIGLTTYTHSISTPAFVDMDGDGDMDMVSGDWYGNFYYYQDTSSTSTPAYAAPVQNPFGLTTIPHNLPYNSTPVFVDMDGDGDMDMLSGDWYGNFYYYQDTSSTSTPAYDTAQVNPFGLTQLTGSYLSVSLVDMDGDGDMDMLAGNRYGNYYYYEDTSSTSTPAYDTAQVNPFGITVPAYTYYTSSPTFVDMDGDGDIDILSGDANGEFIYFENCPTSSDSIAVVACSNPYNSPSGNYTWTTAGVYNDTLQNAAGCDSVLTINLSFDSIPINTYVVQNGANLTASATSATFQWVSCSTDSLILGETNQSYTATANGYYAVMVTDTFGCTDTSACYTVTTAGIKNNQTAAYKIYPNPVNNKLNIAGAKNISQVEIYSIDGRLLETVSSKGNTGNISIDFEKYQKGMYLVKLYFKEGSVTTNLITK